MSTITSHFTQVNNLKIHYLSVGTGEPILFIHGIPTSSFLWRNVLPALGKTHRAIAIDLPGYGKSEKRLNSSFNFFFFEDIIEGFLNNLEITKTNLVVHDFGGPVGLFWAVRHPEKVNRLVLTNTLVYPQLSWGVKLFMLLLRIPILKNLVFNQSGIAAAMRFGVQKKERMTKDLLKHYQEPFKSKIDQQVLLKSAVRVSIKGFYEIEQKLPQLKMPVTCIYGENDRILPKVAATMKRVQQDLPQTTLHSIPNCGHFLQEDEPEKLNELLIEFLE